jgi:hypothetical protein
MPQLAAIQVLLELTVRSNPPISPVDINTGLPPAIWCGEDVDFNIGIFDPLGDSVDLSNLQYLELDIFPMQLPAQGIPTDLGYAPYTQLPYPSTPPAPLLSVTVPAGSITPTINRGDWLNGVAQQAVMSLGWVNTASLSLGGLTSATFWLSVHGITSIGRKIQYGGCLIQVYESGQSGIYLPNTVAPIDVPLSTILYVIPNQQLTFSATISVEGTIQIEGELIQV